jgi:hypothetical protein
MRRIAAVLIWLVLAVAIVGCAQTLRLKTVDASTGKPVAGVCTSLSQYRADMLHRAEEVGAVNLPCSDDNGIIIVRGFHKSWWLSEFTFSRQGYLNTYGQYNENRLRFSTNITNSNNIYGLGSPFSNVFELQKPIVLSQFSNGFFLISLEPNREMHARPSPDMSPVTSKPATLR